MSTPLVLDGLWSRERRRVIDQDDDRKYKIAVTQAQADLMSAQADMTMHMPAYLIIV